MNWSLTLSGASAVLLLALGFELAQVGHGLAPLCDLAGIIAATTFVALADGA